MNLSKEAQAWLLAAPEPYIRYQAQRLLAPNKADGALLDNDPFIRGNLRILSNWRKDVLSRHDKPDLFIHRLAMMADLGVTRDTIGAKSLIEDLLDNIAADGTFRVNIMIPQGFGGSGKPHPDWIICDFPVVVYALIRMAGKDERIRSAVRKIIQLAGEEYYPCCGSIPKFRGPGPKNGMCPYANLLVARALAADAAGRKSPEAKLAANAVLDSWTHRKTKKPFLFGMGTDFLKLKFPMVWYNLLHVVSALKNIPGIAGDTRYLKLAGHLRRKLDPSGKATPESIYLTYKSEEWSDKKNPSRLLTILVHQVLRGLE
ncbi:MAG: hypothetical protein JW748_11355 [Anaerolineales bacterium]|nr:hypothetical protein [Anaerolineales bacterium]